MTGGTIQSKKEFPNLQEQDPSQETFKGKKARDKMLFKESSSAKLHVPITWTIDKLF